MNLIVLFVQNTKESLTACEFIMFGSSVPCRKCVGKVYPGAPAPLHPNALASVAPLRPDALALAAPPLVSSVPHLVSYSPFVSFLPPTVPVRDLLVSVAHSLGAFLPPPV